MRRDMLAWRRALPAAELAARSAAVADRLFAGFNVADLGAVHVFLPILRQQELDTWPIIHRLWADFPATRVVVPVTQPDGSLQHRQLTPQTRLLENKWGIPEPADGALVSPAELDAVLVPLLAFDEVGHRVGYGKGFYDRFLAWCRPDVLRIGLALTGPLPLITDVFSGDAQLTACVTPEQVYQF
nr:5-formyltetrahydrofolate cyclo-ligase [Hymenobacter translucens]